MEYLSQPLDFDINRAFELRNTFEKTESNNNIQGGEINDIYKMNEMVSTLPLMNDNIRTNIKLGIEIYKQLKNFDRNYIHSIINEKSTKLN